MPSFISQLADRAFSDDDEDKAWKLMDVTLDSWRETSREVTRTVVFIFILSAIFELLVTAKAANSVSFGGLSFSNTSLLQKFIPALIAYLIYDAYQMTDSYINQGRLYHALIRMYQPGLFKTRLVYVVQPKLRGPWPFTIGQPPRDRTSHVDKIDSAVRYVQFIVAFLILPITFEIQAYYELIHKYGLTNTYSWISIVVASFFVTAFILRLFMAVRYRDT
jgi:hypothetical protein